MGNKHERKGEKSILIKLLLRMIELKIENNTIPKNNSEKKSMKINFSSVTIMVVVVYDCQVWCWCWWCWWWCWWCWWCCWWCSHVMCGWPSPDSGRGTVPCLVTRSSAVEAAHYGK